MLGKTAKLSSFVVTGSSCPFIRTCIRAEISRFQDYCAGSAKDLRGLKNLGGLMAAF
ncbi:Uncharacterized protein dnm_098490 [Desulfonema magnum]|uniref:Uncharacterized protein n=1 Tax=Desulfonema magnum TaxID=45655 RepID=A0A975BZS2_9BACT|nr:Uncharacterized protein dnm_098490 [Desulfonema magnum]